MKTRGGQAPLVRAAGGLVWREDDRVPRLAVIHRPKRGDWSLPKGKLEAGESFRAAALREVAEETGCRARLGDFAGYLLDHRRSRTKLVMFWHMAARRVERFLPNDEVDRLEWLTADEALARLDSPLERKLLRAAVARRFAYPGGGVPARGGSRSMAGPDASASA